MAEPEQNPLTAHLLNMVQGRQQTEIVKVTLLTTIIEKLDVEIALMEKFYTQLEELVERTKG